MYLKQDGMSLKWNEAGVDVGFDSQGSDVEVGETRKYSLVRNPTFGSHLLRLEPQG